MKDNLVIFSRGTVAQTGSVPMKMERNVFKDIADIQWPWSDERHAIRKESYGGFFMWVHQWGAYEMENVGKGALELRCEVRGKGKL